MGSMNALVAQGPGDFRIERIGMPMPAIDEVLIEVHACGICGSDLKMLAGNMEGVAFPLVPGHEWSGIIVEAPSANAQLVGKRVVSDILQNCGHCSACRSGRRNLCGALIEPGLTSQGAFAEYVAVPASSVHLVPEGMSLDIACLAEPLSVVLHALARISPRPGETALIVGGGAIGLLALICLRRLGLNRVALIDTHPDRQQMAIQLGAIFSGGSSDQVGTLLLEEFGHAPSLVVNAASRAESVLASIALCAAGGRICQIGYTGSQTISMRPSDLVVKELQLVASLSPTHSLEATLAVLKDLDVAPFLTHAVPLANFGRAYEMAKQRSDRVIRALIRPQG